MSGHEETRINSDSHQDIMWKIAHIEHLFSGCLRARSERLGAREAYPLLLCELSKSKSITQKELGDRIHLKASTVSVTLQNMEQEGLVSRTTSADDARQTLVSLTSDGEGLDRALRYELKNLVEMAQTGLTDEDINELFRMLNIMYKNILRISGGITEDGKDS